MKVILYLLGGYTLYSMILIVKLFSFTAFDEAKASFENASRDRFVLEEVNKQRLITLFQNVSSRVEELCLLWKEPPDPEPDYCDLSSSCTLNKSLKRLNRTFQIRYGLFFQWPTF